MSNKLRELFGLDITDNLKNTKITDASPCGSCPIHKKYMETAIYGSIGERQYVKEPDECKLCIEYINWKMDCMKKLAWYEKNDNTLKDNN